VVDATAMIDALEPRIPRGACPVFQRRSFREETDTQSRMNHACVYNARSYEACLIKQHYALRRSAL